MADDPVRGEFRVVKMDDLFHVVFRPDDHPQWFRILGTFHTYARAYAYCDVEKVMSYEDFSETADEEREKPTPPSISRSLDQKGQDFDLPNLVRTMVEPGDKCPPPPPLDLKREPGDDEDPKDYRKRLSEEATAVAVEADKMTDLPDAVVSQLSQKTQKQIAGAKEAEQLPERQQAVYDFFVRQANRLNLLEASTKEIAVGSGVPHGSMGFLLETLEKKGLVEAVERGGPTKKGVFRVHPERAAA